MLVKIQSKGQMTIPRGVRSAVGLSDGDVVEIKAVGSRIVITPQLFNKPSRFPSAGSEYTPAQHRMIDARLAEAEKGPYYGPFKSAAEVASFLKKRAQRKAKPGKPKRS